jgi:curved DNA-binding protein CbpA
MTDDFIKKLMVSKQIMDKHNEIPRNTSSSDIGASLNETRISNPQIYSPEPIQANYNIPQEYVESRPVVQSTPPVMTEDRIKNSKLPDAIKDLMLKHPIKQPDSYSPSLSEDVIERAARLMNQNKTITQSASTPKNSSQNRQTQNSNSDIKKIVKEVLEELLTEHGILSESEQKTEETFQFRVGKHIFEGKITKVKKLK